MSTVSNNTPSHTALREKLRLALTRRDLGLVEDISKELDWEQVNADLIDNSPNALTLHKYILPIAINGRSQWGNDENHEPGLTEAALFIPQVLRLWMDCGYNPLLDKGLVKMLDDCVIIYTPRGGLPEEIVQEITQKALSVPERPDLSLLSLLCHSSLSPTLIRASLKAGARLLDCDKNGEPAILLAISNISPQGTFLSPAAILRQTAHLQTALFLIEAGANLFLPYVTPKTPQGMVLDCALEHLEMSEIFSLRDPAAIQLHQELKAHQSRWELQKSVNCGKDVAPRSSPKM